MADYWTTFWMEHGRLTRHDDPQLGVLRTLNKQPISDEAWRETVDFVIEALRLDAGVGHRVLDLCSGNGLFGRELAPHCASLTSVDISADLLAQLDGLGFDHVITLHGDMREVTFTDCAFDRVLLYAAIQYLTKAEAVRLLRDLARWLEPDGVLYIGDVPDEAHLWTFFNTAERRKVYFEKLQQGNGIVGTWFDRQWLINCCLDAGFREAVVVEQPDFMLFSHFRYELVASR